MGRNTVFWLNPATEVVEQLPPDRGLQVHHNWRKRHKGVSNHPYPKSKPVCHPATKQTQARLASPVFNRACTLAGVDCTRRQLSKFHNKRGAAYHSKREAIRQIEEERKHAKG